MKLRVIVSARVSRLGSWSVLGSADYVFSQTMCSDTVNRTAFFIWLAFLHMVRVKLQLHPGLGSGFEAFRAGIGSGLGESQCLGRPNPSLGILCVRVI